MPTYNPVNLVYLREVAPDPRHDVTYVYFEEPDTHQLLPNFSDADPLSGLTEEEYTQATTPV